MAHTANGLAREETAEVAIGYDLLANSIELSIGTMDPDTNDLEVDHTYYRKIYYKLWVTTQEKNVINK